MFLRGFLGLLTGFIIGMALNSYMLKGVTREQMLRDKNLRLRYGLLNWLVAFLGMAIALEFNSP